MHRTKLPIEPSCKIFGFLPAGQHLTTNIFSDIQYQAVERVSSTDLLLAYKRTLFLY